MYNDRPGMLREAGLRNALFDLLEEAIPGGGEPVNLPDEEVIKTISDMIKGSREELEKEDHHEVEQLKEELEEVRADFAQCLAMEKQAELWADKAAHYKITLGCAEKALRNLPRHTVTSIITGSDTAFISGIAVGVADFIKGEMDK